MAKAHTVVIDDTLCIGCGACERDCVSGCITVQNKKAVANKTGCIACGHCEAVCPKGAVTLTGFHEDCVEYSEQTRLVPEGLMQAIRTRRSIRQFQQTEVPEAVLRDIIEAGRLAPTGGNAQNTGFIVLGSKQAELEQLAVAFFRKMTGFAKSFVSYLKEHPIDDHFFFKGAPLVIVITGNAVNASLAAENMAFMAEAHGLGVLFSGFYTVCANRSRKIRKVMQMGKKEKAVTTLVIGYPNVAYHRTVRRENARLRKL